MPNIDNAVAYALAQSGKPYRAYGERFGPDFYDCSGLVIGSLRQAGVYPPSWVGNTVGLYKWGKEIGGLVSVAKGVAVRGSIMIKGRDYGYGPLGHTSFSLGDGREMAAHGYRSGIHANQMNASYYHDALIIPGVLYPSLAPPVDPDVLAYLKHLQDWKASFASPRNNVDDGKTVGHLERGDTNGRVTTLNDLLILNGYMGPGRKSNTYHRYTETAVRNMKVVEGLEGGGKKFGADAAEAILSPQ